MSNNSMAKILDKVKFLDNVKILPGGVSNTPTYSLQRSVAPVEGGGSEITFTVNTTNVADGTSLPYTISGVSSSDVTSGSLTGNFTVANNTASTTLETSLNSTSPGVGSASLALDNGAASISVFPVPTYSLSRSATFVDEGSSITFTLTTTGVANGTSVPYTISGISAGDLSSGSLNGNFVINEGSATMTVALAADALTDGSETISITAAGQSSSASVNDTSLTPELSLTPTYTLSRSSASLNEGSSVTFTLVTSNVADGTNIPYSITGISAGDLSSGSLTGNFVVNNGSASLTLTAASDLLSEGYETITIAAAGQTSTSTINDTSVTVLSSSAFVTKAIAFPSPGSSTPTSNLYALHSNSKLYKSENMGSTWTSVGQLTATGLGASSIRVSSNEMRVIPFSINYSDISGYTFDGGNTWQAGGIATAARVLGVNSDLNLITSATSITNSTTQYRIQRSSIFTSEIPLSSVGPNLARWSAMYMSGNGSVVYASTVSGTTNPASYNYKSIDAGVTWNQLPIVASGFHKLWCSYDGSVVFAQTKDGGSSLSRSVNGGVSWTGVYPGKYNAWGFSKDGSTILLGRLESSSPSRSLYLSKNSGTTWSLLTDVFPSANARLGNSLFPDNDIWHVCVNDDGTKFAIATKHGRLFVSENSGVTWSQKYVS